MYALKFGPSFIAKHGLKETTENELNKLIFTKQQTSNPTLKKRRIFKDLGFIDNGRSDYIYSHAIAVINNQVVIFKPKNVLLLMAALSARALWNGSPLKMFNLINNKESDRPVVHELIRMALLGEVRRCREGFLARTLC